MAYNPSKKNLSILEDRIQTVGMSKEIERYAPQIQAQYKHLKLQHPGMSKHEMDFVCLAKAVRHLTKKDLIWFAKFISNHEKVERVHGVTNDFIKNGFSALPEDYKEAEEDQGGYFSWHPNPDYILIMLPRGIGKTTTFHCINQIHHIINNPTYKFLVVHSDIDRAKKNLTTTRGLMMNKFLALIQPELFTDSVKKFRKIEGNRLTNYLINVSYNEEIVEKSIIEKEQFRGEDSLMLGSLRSDPTGNHFEKVFLDDIVIPDTSKTPEVTNNVIDYIQALSSLEEHRKENKFQYIVTGTEQYENNAYDWIKNRKKTTCFQMPATWKYNGERQYIASYVNDDWLESKRDSQQDWFGPHELMIPRSYEDNSIDLEFSDENIINISENQLEDLKSKGMIAQICDPAYSKKDKREGDKKSRFTIINAVVTREAWYVFDCFQTKGEDTGKIKEYNIDKALQHEVEYFVQDAQGVQSGLFDELRDILLQTFPTMDFFKHEKSPLTDTTQKFEVANRVLKERFLDKEIYVVVTGRNKRKMDLVINQLRRENLGMDIIDCIVYMVADIDRVIDVPIAMSKRRKLIEKRKRKLYNKATTQNKTFRRLA